MESSSRTIEREGSRPGARNEAELISLHHAAFDRAKTFARAMHAAAVRAAMIA
jgi:hypothetical protein